MVAAGCSLLFLLAFGAWSLNLLDVVEQEREAVNQRVRALMASREAGFALEQGEKVDLAGVDVPDTEHHTRFVQLEQLRSRGDLAGVEALLLEHERALRADNAAISTRLGERWDTLGLVVLLALGLGASVTGLLLLGAMREERLRMALQEAARAREEAEALEQMKDSLLADTAHELRTPLAGLLGLVELSREDPSHLDEALVHGHRMASLLTDLLDLARMRTGTWTLLPEPTRVRPLLERVIAPLQSEATPIRLTFDGPAWLELDGRRLQQAVGNLIGNAVRHASGAPIDVDVHWADDVLTIEVRDHGPGLGPDPGRLFERHVRREGGGLGIGLTVVDASVRRWGGTIEARNRPEGGAVFHIELPCPITAPPDVVEASTAPPWATAAVLVVEDDPTLRMIARRVLERAGYRVREVTSGEEALDSLEEPTLAVLMDWHLPGIDGMETVRRLRQSGLQVPILALTARASREDTAAALEAGCDAHLAKPVQPDVLVRTLTELVER